MNCLLRAFAEALDITPEVLIQGLGHDGQEIVWPELPEPLCRRGFHVQEFILWALNEGVHITTIEATIRQAPTTKAHPYVQDNQPEINGARKVFRGVLTGLLVNGSRHAIAWRPGMQEPGLRVEWFYVLGPKLIQSK